MEAMTGASSPEEEAVGLRRGRPLTLPDAIIYATARVHGRTLATRNTRDFREGEVGVDVPYVLQTRSTP